MSGSFTPGQRRTLPPLMHGRRLESGQVADSTDLHVLQLMIWARRQLAQGHLPLVQIAGISSAL